MIGNENRTTKSYQFDGIITYDRTFGKHHIDAFAGYEQYESNFNMDSVYKYTFPVFQSDQFGYASQDPTNTTAGGKEAQDARISYIGRVNYDYAEKYLLSASFREDGSIKFAPDQRWGFYPSVSAAWVISNENFFNIKQIDRFKIRASYGTTGNDVVGGWLWKELYYPANASYYVGNGLSPISQYSGLNNPNLTWETSKSYDVGVDVNFLSHWNLIADVWRKSTENILGPRILTLPIEFGTSYPQTNYGKIDAKGFEFELGYSNGKIAKDVTFNIKANFGYAVNKVVLEDYQANALPCQNPVGKPLGYLIGYENTGVIKTQKQLDALPAGYTIFGAKPELV